VTAAELPLSLGAELQWYCRDCAWCSVPGGQTGSGRQLGTWLTKMWKQSHRALDKRLPTMTRLTASAHAISMELCAVLCCAVM
jgi:hypothetical protein